MIGLFPVFVSLQSVLMLPSSRESLIDLLYIPLMPSLSLSLCLCLAHVCAHSFVTNHGWFPAPLLSLSLFLVLAQLHNKQVISSARSWTVCRIQRPCCRICHRDSRRRRCSRNSAATEALCGNDPHPHLCRSFGSLRTDRGSGVIH